MSSLAGALDSTQDTLDAPMSSPKLEDDMDDVVPAAPAPAAESADEDDKEELNDLFGEDEDVTMVEREYVHMLLLISPSMDPRSFTSLEPPLPPLPTSRTRTRTSPPRSAVTVNSSNMPRTKNQSRLSSIGSRQTWLFQISLSLRAPTAM